MAASAFSHCRRLIRASLYCAKPRSKAMKAFNKPLADVFVASGKNCKKGNPFFDHHRAFAETVLCLECFLSSTPMQVIEQRYQQAEFYVMTIQRLGKKSADISPKHTDFAKALKKCVSKLKSYVKSNFSKGLVWQSKVPMVTCSSRFTTVLTTWLCRMQSHLKALNDGVLHVVCPEHFYIIQSPVRASCYVQSSHVQIILLYHCDHPDSFNLQHSM